MSLEISQKTNENCLICTLHAVQNTDNLAES